MWSGILQRLNLTSDLIDERQRNREMLAFHESNADMERGDREKRRNGRKKKSRRAEKSDKSTSKENLFGFIWSVEDEGSSH